ncbi:hypothetical protein QNO08_03775 [Arthrobacter sp. zg-Y820]|uniref:hypothetical protein n=1 Tax=unclassified Arthrobacter TaxID=235627 RepID=UPI001E4370C8|nr:MULTISPECIES: hypothetical protein [unclassified Arthrobacter]MCC9195456.1 hypothetical protein [Arthrobacter sp. zg-Y820]MDK1278315.1 hypothetical protein [Arthrobacter sp. zg.Y820]MDK1361202.1 hypothetical protein [Arthrobacter sp. zg-Y1219]WIB10194.1 hypothetical protein QNO08_03775 [Arthrobacter sp. zg-Y820]
MNTSSGLLLDIGILTRIRGASPDPVITDFLARRRHQRMFISALSLCELSPARDPDSAAEDGWVRELATRFAANILPVDHHVALACEHNGPLSPAVLAATARHHHLTVVSADAARYAGLDVRVLDPLAEPQPRPVEPGDI